MLERKQALSGSTGAQLPRPASLRQTIKAMLPQRTAEGLGNTLLPAQVKSGSLMADPTQFKRAGHERECPICGHPGRLWRHGTPPRGEAMSLRCISLDAQRLMNLHI